jgi:two-component system, sensor histidine kinase and response regulator
MENFINTSRVNKVLPVNHKQKKILIVESSPNVRQQLTELLEKNDYKITIAENGYDGYKFALHEPPDLIIADIVIPMMNGLEMLKLLRENSYTSEIPFIFLTEKAATIDRRIGMNSGADDYLSIPFKSDDILNALKTRLEKKDGIDKKFDKVFRSISGNIPHELRTPLGSIIGFTNMMLDEFYSLEKTEMVDMLLKIKGASLRLHKTIEKFIIFSEAEVLNMDKTNNAKLLAKETEVNAFLLYSVTTDKMKVEENSIPVNLETTYGKIQIAEDYFMIMLGELVENAIKFSFPNKPIDIYSSESESAYTLTVKNYGRGMTEEEIASMAPFNQHNRQKYEQQGNGLGLMIVSSLATFFNVGFNLISVPDQYTEASLRFRKVLGKS